MAGESRRDLLTPLTAVAPVAPGADELGARLAVLSDGGNLSAVDLGPDRPAATGLTLARVLGRAA